MARSTTEMAARGRPEVLVSFYGSSWAKNKGRQLLTFPAVEHGSAEHLIPHFVGVSRILADDESFEVLFDEPAGRGTAETSRITDSTIRGMYLHYRIRYMVSGGLLMRMWSWRKPTENTTEDANTPGSSGDFVFFVFVHRT